MADEPAFDVLGQAAEALAGLALPLTTAAQAQQAAAAAQQQAAQQQYAGGFPAWAQPDQTPQQAAQQQAAMQAALQQAAQQKAARDAAQQSALAAAQQAAAAQAQQPAASPAPAQPPLPLTQPGYVYQPQTPQQAAQQQAQRQQQYPSGGTPAWAQPQAPAPTPMQQAQQQAAAAPPGPSPGTLGLAAARATPMPPQGAGGGAGWALGGFEGALRGAAAGLLVMRAAAQQAEGAFLGMAAKASPTAAATYQGSQDLFMARLGSHVLPALEEASRAIQAAARIIPDPSQKIGGVSIFERIFPQVTLARQAMDALGVDKPLASFKGLPTPRISSAEEYSDRITRAGLGAGPLEAELQREQLRNLQDMKLLLEKIAGGAPPAGNFR